MADRVIILNRDSKPNLSDQFRTITGRVAKVPVMAGEKHVQRALDAYVRHRLDELVRGGRKVVDMAREVGLPAPGIHQVRGGTLGIGAKTLPRYAKLLSLTPGELYAEAERWFAEHGAEARETVQAAARSPELAEAIEAVKTLQNASDPQLETIVAAFGADRFRDRDRAWWVQTLLSELERDRRTHVMPATEEREAARKRAQHRKLRRQKDDIERNQRPTPARKKHAAS